MVTKKIGKYELGEELGRGAMGVVYRAYDTLLNRDVALKLMIHAEQGSSESKRRFYREAQSAGSLMHDNIVKVFDLGDDGGAPYIVMEFLPGEDLKELMTQGRLTRYRDILKIWLQICNGLNHAHKRGIVHRDIKPGNIRITPGGRVKIMDFGIAKKPSSNLTQSGVVLGTVDYMAPEQVKGTGADSRSDLFSLGVMFYEMLALRKPFPGDSVTSVIYRIVYEQPDAMEPIRVECPPDTRDIVLRLLAKDAAARYQTAMEVAKALKASYSGWKASAGGAPETRTIVHDRDSRGPAGPPPPAARVSSTFVPPETMAPSSALPALDEERTTLHPRRTPGTAPQHVAGPEQRAPSSTYPSVGSLTPPTAVPVQPPSVAPVPLAGPTPPAYVPSVAPPTTPDRAYQPQLSIGDLPIRPDQPSRSFDQMTYQSPPAATEALPPRMAGRGAPTAIDLDVPDYEEPRAARRFPIFWVSMLVLFFAVIAGGAMLVKTFLPVAAPTPGPTPAPTAPTVETAPLPTATATTRPTPVAPVQTAWLQITSNLPAEVLVNGRSLGRIPVETPFEVPVGRLHVMLRDVQFGLTVERDLDAAPGAKVTEELPFEGEGFVMLRARPWAYVIVDGKESDKIEVSPAHGPIRLGAGTHTFRFEQLGKSTSRDEIVVPGKTIDISVDMTALP